MSIKDRIRALRQSYGLSQQELAKKLEVGQNTITSYESGRTEPSLAKLAKLAEIFDVTTDYLIGIEAQADKDSDLIDRIRALSPTDRIVAHKIISALNDREKIQAHKSNDA